MSQGFHPKAKISSPSALALGIAGEDEVLDLELDENAEPVETDRLLASLNGRSIEGLEFLSARLLGDREQKARMESGTFSVRIPEASRSRISEKIGRLMNSESAVVEKSNGKKVDVRPAIVSLDFFPETGELRTEILANKQAHNGPEVGFRDLLATLDLEKELFRSLFPRRTKVRLAET